MRRRAAKGVTRSSPGDYDYYDYDYYDDYDDSERGGTPNHIKNEQNWITYMLFWSAGGGGVLLQQK